MLKLLYRLERLLVHVGKASRRLYVFVRYFRLGKENGYPTCCVLHFALDGGRGKENSAIRRGSVFPQGNENHHYVPCAYHKVVHPDWAPWEGYSRRQLQLF